MFDHLHPHHHHPKTEFGSDFHRPELRQKERKLLYILILINLLGMLVEIIGGLLTNSLALLSDAGHMFTHILSLLVSYVAIVLAMRAKTTTMSFGYFRMEILAAFFNGVTVLGIAVLIVVEATRKLFMPSPIMVREMVFVALFGLFINLLGAFLLLETAKKDINLRSVVVHMLSDTLSSVAILLGGVVIYFTNWVFVDALLGLLIAVVIGFWGVGLVRTSSKILLQAVPEGIDPDEVVKSMLEISEIKDVHDVHIWELTSGKYVMTGHILTEDLSISQSEDILERVNQLIHKRFAIGHTTFQFEVRAHSA